MQDMWVQFLDWEDPLEKEMTTDSSILAWETPLAKKAGGLQSMWSQRIGHDLATKQQQIPVMESSSSKHFRVTVSAFKLRK